MLNILLTFAQFEREMLADRIRDKAHALRRAGRWIGGAAPYGYEKRLVPNDAEAAIVRLIHERYLELQSAHQVTREMEARGMRSKSWVNRAGDARYGVDPGSTRRWRSVSAGTTIIV